LVATSQNECTPHDAEKRSNGFPHIRVWNHIRIETIRIIGLGTLKRPVYKMTFLSFQVRTEYAYRFSTTKSQFIDNPFSLIDK